MYIYTQSFFIYFISSLNPKPNLKPGEALHPYIPTCRFGSMESRPYVRMYMGSSLVSETLSIPSIPLAHKS